MQQSRAAAVHRDLRIDLLRGAALLVIFSGHIRDNRLSEITPARLGYSDMAEIFVFLSGYVCGLSYLRSTRERGLLHAQYRALGRSAQLYLAYLLSVVVLGLIVVSTESAASAIPLAAERVAFHRLATTPGAAILDLLLLRLPVGHLGILPLYIVLLTLLPIVVRLAERSAALALALPVSLYAAVQFDLPLPRLPELWDVAWYFNPFAWQLLFFGAALLAMAGRQRRERVLGHPVVIALAWSVLAGLLAWKAGQGDHAVPLTEKANLQPIRLLHFAALVVVGRAVMPRNSPLWSARCLAPLRLCGRNSLITYCAGAVLSVLATICLAGRSESLFAQIAVNVGGWTACCACAGIWERIRSKPK